MNDIIPLALLIEDEPHIRQFVRTALESAGWEVHESATLERGLIDASVRKPELIILDLGLPDGDGITFLGKFRAWSTTPVIVLSARINEEDKVRALDAGADDYVTKPFGTAELLARVRSARRRRYELNTSLDGTVCFGDVVVDIRARQVKKAGSLIHLTPTEYRLLSVLAENAGRVMTSVSLLNQVWGPNQRESAHYLRIYMGHLRHKLEDDPAQPQFLLTESAVGYRLSVHTAD